MQYTIYPSGAHPDLEAVCCYCNDSLTRGSGKVKGPVLREHISSHNFRNCNQRLYFSAQQFRQHLQDSHKANYDGTLFAGWTLLLKSSEQSKKAVFEAVEHSSVRRAETEPKPAGIRSMQRKAMQDSPEPRLNFMDFSETPQTSATPRKKIRRKPSAQTVPGDLVEEMRESTVGLTRAVTVDVITNKATLNSQNSGSSSAKKRKKREDMLRRGTGSHFSDVASCELKFYRRRLDASTRNRVYIRNDAEGALTPSSQKVFREVSASAFGSLILHSSLLAATPARLTNSVDIYSLP